MRDYVQRIPRLTYVPTQWVHVSICIYFSTWGTALGPKYVPYGYMNPLEERGFVFDMLIFFICFQGLGLL